MFSLHMICVNVIFCQVTAAIQPTQIPLSHHCCLATLLFFEEGHCIAHSYAV
uniref:Uncharacterized protein n=1 Tax=Anguilla anguilla TaxID=7936 RepID=A0A0E9Q905_ANGAN